MLHFTDRAKREGSATDRLTKQCDLVGAAAVEGIKQGVGLNSAITEIDQLLDMIRKTQKTLATDVDHDRGLEKSTQETIAANKKGAKELKREARVQEKAIAKLLKKPELTIKELIFLDKHKLSLLPESDHSTKLLKDKLLVHKHHKHKIIRYRLHRVDKNEPNFIMLAGFDSTILKDTPGLTKGWIEIDEQKLLDLLQKSDASITIKVENGKPISPHELVQYINTLKAGMKTVNLVRDELKKHKPRIQTHHGTRDAINYVELENQRLIFLDNYDDHIWILANPTSITFAIEYYPKIAELNTRIKELQPFKITSFAICLARNIKEGKLIELIPKLPEWGGNEKFQAITEHESTFILDARKHLRLVVKNKTTH